MQQKRHRFLFGISAVSERALMVCFYSIPVVKEQGVSSNPWAYPNPPYDIHEITLFFDEHFEGKKVRKGRMSCGENRRTSISDINYGGEGEIRTLARFNPPTPLAGEASSL